MEKETSKNKQTIYRNKGFTQNICYEMNEHVALISENAVFSFNSHRHGSVFRCFLSFFGGSLGTTTSPQQQNATELKDLCQVRNA